MNTIAAHSSPGKEIDWRRGCVAIIPCLNEGRGIGALVAEVREHVEAVIVIDDGSSDFTASEAVASGALVLRCGRRKGKGSALRRGLREARGRGFPWALLIDGDGQHSPDDIPVFFARAENSSAAMFIGNRMGNAREIPWLRRTANRTMSWCLSKHTGSDLPDSQCGFRLVQVACVAELHLKAAGFIIESEMLVSLLATGGTVEFVPIRVIYGAEKSKISPLLDTWRWLKWWMVQLYSAST